MLFTVSSSFCSANELTGCKASGGELSRSLRCSKRRLRCRALTARHDTCRWALSLMWPLCSRPCPTDCGTKMMPPSRAWSSLKHDGVERWVDGGVLRGLVWVLRGRSVGSAAPPLLSLEPGARAECSFTPPQRRHCCVALCFPLPLRRRHWPWPPWRRHRLRPARVPLPSRLRHSLSSTRQVSLCSTARRRPGYSVPRCCSGAGP